jgi:hypothetical protein
VTGRNAKRRPAKPLVESSVYAGRELVGVITPKAGAFVAHLASGKALGRFANERLAQRAITSAARLERPNNFGGTQHD